MEHQDQLVEMIRDRFDSQDRKLEEIKCSLSNHVEKDEEYWRQIDVQAGQIQLLKAIGGSSIFAGAMAWLWNKFH